MKRISIKTVSVILSLMMIFSFATIFGSSAATGYYTISAGVLTKCVTGATGVIDDIPSTVTEIKGNAFKNCESITEVVIPSNVKKVGNNAFDSCTSLKKVTFEGADCTIGNAAFIHCSALQEITLPSMLLQIPNEAFYDCTSLKSIEIPASVTLIGKEAFNMCRSLTEINIPASVKTIRTVVIENGKNTAVNPFLGCINVKAFNVESGNTVYSSVGGVLYGPLISPYDPNINSSDAVTDKSLINYPGGAKATSFTVPSDVVRISSDAFNSNKVLQSVTLPDGLKSIESHAFFTCTALRSINIPSSVTKIGARAFDGCPYLEFIKIPASVTSFENAFSYSGLKTVEFENGLKTISSGSFDGCSKLETVKIPASVTSIEAGAFNGCPSTMTIVADKNSFAYNYAIENGFKVSSGSGDVNVNKTVSSISVYSNPDKTNYIYKEKIDPKGLELQVIYTDGSSEIINSGYEISPNTAGRTGNIAVKVEYEGQYDFFTVSVSYAWWQWIIRIILLGFLWY